MEEGGLGWDTDTLIYAALVCLLLDGDEDEDVDEDDTLPRKPRVKQTSQKRKITEQVAAEQKKKEKRKRSLTSEGRRSLEFLNHQLTPYSLLLKYPNIFFSTFPHPPSPILSVPYGPVQPGCRWAGQKSSVWILVT